jgi:succinyl-CoA synthetase beta subunit
MLRDTAQRQNVKAVLINIFGGILRVTCLRLGCRAAKTHYSCPSCCAEGTNVRPDAGSTKQSGLNFIMADTMKDAAEKVVAAAA